MKSSDRAGKPLNIAWYLLFSLVFLAQVIPGIYQNSPTDDEPLDLTNGYFYWTGDVVTHNRHPPLSPALQALPLRWGDLNDHLTPSLQENQLRAYQFFFVWNKGRFEWMTSCGRWVSVLFGLGIGILLFFQIRPQGFWAGLAAISLWAFHPTLLAYSGLALADITVTFFLLAAVIAFQRHLENPGTRWSLLSGGLAALAACSKFSALALIPVFILLEGQTLYSLSKTRKPHAWPQVTWDWLAGSAAFLLAVCAVYFPGTLFQPDHRFPFVYFLRGLEDLMGYSGYHHPVYFLGKCTRQNHWLFFPSAFLLKNTIPFTLLSFVAVGTALGKRNFVPAWIWVTPLVFSISILPVQNLGVRYLLPAIPFLILMASKMAGEWSGKKTGKLLVGGLLLWNALSVLVNGPHLIGYFNDLIPPGKKVYYLSDSDLDMGQDVKRLAQVGLQRGWKKVKLAQFGGALDPSLYGLTCVPWTQRDLLGPQPGQVYAVNVTLFQTGPVFSSDLLPIAKSWASTAVPTGRVGDSWLFFETPGEPTPDPSPSLSSMRIF